MNYNFLKLPAFILLLFLFGALAASAQPTVIKGTITDSKTHEPLPFVIVVFKGTQIGTTTDEQGKFILRTDKPYQQLQISYIGYKTSIRNIVVGKDQTINIKLESSAITLKEITVKGGKKQKYRNKDNPAVELIRQVIEHKEKNRIESYEYVEYEEYEKLLFSIINDPAKMKKRKAFKKYHFVFENLDTTKIEGKALLPIYIQEKIADIYYRKNPEKKKSIIKADKKVSFDDFIDNDGVSQYLNNIYQDVNLYDNNIMLFNHQFLSPISGSAPTFYKYFITDTVIINGDKLVELNFGPRNQGDYLFQGAMYITLDGNFAVRKVDMSVNKDINLNWVRGMEISQDFERNEQNRYFLAKTDISAEFGFTKNGIFGERSVSVKNFKTNIPHPDSTYEGIAVETVKNADKKGNEYWQENRHDTLKKVESNVYQNIDSLQKMPSFRRTMDILNLVLSGYKSVGPFEVGPVNTFYSFNPVEGFRLRFGGRSTVRFHENIFLETYTAYGFKDQKWKYFLAGTYSFTKRPMFEYPQRYIRGSFQKDTKIPGQELQFVQEDNFLLSFKRGVNDKWLYNDIYNLEYVHEFGNRFAYRLGFKNWSQQPAGGLKYLVESQDGTSDLHQVNNLTTTEFSLNLRWAPKEQFYQGRTYRTPIPNKYPIITLRAIAGVKGIFNSEYNYQNLALNLYKRFYLSQLGYTDITTEGGYVFGKVPFPLLSVHRANQTYSYQLESYNLMNFLEFVSDHYTSVFIDHYFNGFILNKFPLVKHLKLREVVTCKILYGGIRAQNRPENDPSLYLFPQNENGVTTTYSLEKQPYIEASFGIANIFKLFRVDIVKRFTYLDNPNVTEYGIRARFKLDF